MTLSISWCESYNYHRGVVGLDPTTMTVHHLHRPCLVPGHVRAPQRAGDVLCPLPSSAVRVEQFVRGDEVGSHAWLAMAMAKARERSMEGIEKR